MLARTRDGGRAVVDKRYKGLEKLVSLQGLLGYLNFAGGKTDARFQKQVGDAYGFLAENGAEEPWKTLHDVLRAELDALKTGGSSAFRDIKQAHAVLELVFTKVLPTYRQHHTDLLFHLSDRELYQPFFLVRVFEAVLLQGAPWSDERRIVTDAVRQLNDYVGHRPVAILETLPKGEPYDHERVRPIPLFIRGAGVAWGRYHDLVGKALDILSVTDPGLLADAYFDPELLDELAFDPRAYDHGHPVNRRPNYVFGEWDPHHLDTQSRYRRYVARKLTLDALLDWVEQTDGRDRAELLFEAAAVLAGTMLMATGTSGSSPATHDSSTTLATLMPRIARYRDTFYANLMETVSGGHGERLRQEAQTTRQPFGGVRQHLNQYLARHRAGQLQQRQLAIVFADMGYPSSSRREAARIPAASVRLLSEILSRLTTGQLLVDRGRPAEAAAVLPEVEDLLRRGIACGAFVDPWNILGFQGLFPLFAAREDSIRDGRIDELVQVMEHTFTLYSRLASEAAAVGDQTLGTSLRSNLRRLAAWWDRFASTSVSDVRRVHGGETVVSTEHVATALSHWRERGETAADLAFWREHLEGFHSAKAFALVVDALLRKHDYRASMALLMNWLGQADQVPLDDGEHSFHALALRWMLSVMGGDRQGGERQAPSAERQEAGRTTPGDVGSSALRAPRSALAHGWPLIKKFFDYLESNAEEYWQVPALELDHGGSEAVPEREEESLYSAAWEEVTYRDSADDNQEGAVADGGEEQDEFDLEREGGRIARRLRFLSTVARLWQIAAHHNSGSTGISGLRSQEQKDTFALWLTTARQNQEQLLTLLDTLGEQQIPQPLGSYDSLVEYDRRRQLKEQLLYTAINTCLDTSMAVATLEGVVGTAASSGEIADKRPPWQPMAIQLEQALLQGDAGAARKILPDFIEHFQHEPLLLTALADGGQPRQILRVRIAQTVLRAVLTNLPRLGLLRETYHLLKTARAMEQAHPPQGRGVTEFNHLFQAAYQAVVEAVVDSAMENRSGVVSESHSEGASPKQLPTSFPSPARDQELVDLLETITRPFLTLWVEHSQTLQLSAIEAYAGEEEWQRVRAFVERYGGDLFHAKFMTLANLRGILHRGVGSYLDYLRDNPDPLHPVQLIDDLGQNIGREDAVRVLQWILQTLIENYEEYKDYNTTTPQSDYGQNLYLLLDFLRLKAAYERHSWRLRPLVQAHEVLARRKRGDFAHSWEEAFTRLTNELADQYLQRLAQLERTHGMRLGTVADRLQERFVKPLALDRLCALIEPAMIEARQAGEGSSFARLEKELHALTATPTGVGLDVPQWLRRLELEVERVRAARTTVAVLAEGLLHVPKRALTIEELKQQVEDWDKPLGGTG
jgi:hypothetical protein